MVTSIDTLTPGADNRWIPGPLLLSVGTAWHGQGLNKYLFAE